MELNGFYITRPALLLFGDNIPVLFKGLILLFNSTEVAWLADDEHTGVLMNSGNCISKTRLFFPFFRKNTWSDYFSAIARRFSLSQESIENFFIICFPEEQQQKCNFTKPWLLLLWHKIPRNSKYQGLNQPPMHSHKQLSARHYTKREEACPS